LSHALELYNRIGYERDVAFVHQDLGTLYLHMGDLTASLSQYQTALQKWRRLGHLWGLTNILNNIGVNYHYLGQYEAARRSLQEALRTGRSWGGLRLVSYALVSLGTLERDLGRYEAAMEAYEEGLDLAEQVHEAYVIISALDGLGNTYRLQKKYAQATEMLERALLLSQESGGGQETSMCLASLGALCCDEGYLDEGLEHLRKAESLAEGGNARELARIRFHLARAYYLRQEHQRADGYLRELAVLLDRPGYEQLLVAEGRIYPEIIEYALSQRIGGNRFAAVLRKIRELAGEAEAAQPRRVAQSPPPLRVYGLGPGRVWKGERAISMSEWGSTASRDLFFFFLTSRRELRKEQVIDIFWPDSPLPKANSLFHSTMHRARRVLREYGDILPHDKATRTYSLNPDLPYWFDVEEFRHCIAEAHRAEAGSDEQREWYIRGIELYKGGFLEDSYADWCIGLRDELQREYFDALMAVAAHYSERNDYAAAISYLEKAISVDSFSEEAYCHLMLCHDRLGNRTAAIRTFRECCEVLETELGAEPSAETLALYERIVHGGA